SDLGSAGCGHGAPAREAWRVIPIPARAAGAVIPERIVTVDARRLMAYAAGIGAQSAMYSDTSRPQGIVAPPTFTAALEWPLMMSPEYLAAVGRNEDTAFERLVHGFQISRFHRAIAPGDRLSVSGRVEQVQATPAGALVTTHIVTV